MNARSPLRFLANFLLVGLTAVFAARGHAEHKPSHVFLDVGRPAPDFTLPDLDGTTRKLSDYRGKVVLLNFWSTWCTPCRTEMPSMQRSFERHKGNGLEILAVSLNVEGKPPVEQFMKELKLTFKALLDPKKEVATIYRIYALPTSYVIDKQGKIAFKLIGEKDWDDPHSHELIQGLLTK
ncbi:MAG: TlpA family protein disulfide reductase [candidate division NC10 bacterium]|nr:TlpA family protein disulfide reductase [candidate division NC10 bacterium]